MSLIFKFCEAIGKGIGTVVAHKVKKDLEYTKNMEDKAFYKTKSFEDRINELEAEEFLGEIYLDELIGKSNKLEHLQSIQGYLETEEKSANLSNDDYYSLLRKVKTKINEKKKEEELEELLNYVKSMKKKGMVG